ncbi:AraC family transcriptional regulator [Aggregatilinea lenta]|uniref:AraC family transcriptional regulator n=1 Tax=Aggregatilinea lenta TaxID=913108 RepID=UPI000E5A9671|nr:AraC family transcriptional regulator [Aggregatilinea lenta]
MPSNPPTDQGIIWCLPHVDNLRFMRARYVQHAFKPHAHDYFVIGIIEEGVQSFTHEHERHITIPGKLIVINPGELHTGEAAIEEGFSYRALYPSVDLMRAIGREFVASSGASGDVPRFSGSVIQDPQLFRWIQKLHRLSEHLAPGLQFEEALNTFLVELSRRHAADRLALPDYHDAHRAVQQVCDYLEAHFDEGITLADLSQQVHITPYHLTRLFSQQVGIPPHRYLENVRVRQAERLLTSGMPIADVAYATGFSSQSHFTRRFKQFIGTTPAQFAQQRKIV